MIGDFLNTNAGQIIISIILGVGLASLFRKVCSGNSCVVIQGPKKSETEKFYYKLNDDCYKYNSYVAPCNGQQS